MITETLNSRSSQHSLWTVNDLCQFMRLSKSWIYKRTGPKATKTPRIPHCSEIGGLRFDPKVVVPLLTAAPSHVRSLKIEKTGDYVVQTPIKRRKERLW